MEFVPDWSLILITVAVALVVLYYWPIWLMGSYPPGPVPLPFIGNRLVAMKGDNWMKKMAGLYSRILHCLQFGCLFIVCCLSVIVFFSSIHLFISKRF